MRAQYQFSASTKDFFNGLVFGFDVGTGSIGYVVRKGAQFKDVGVLICPEETNDLSGRRALRRQRRTLRSRGYRHKWFARQLIERAGLNQPTEADRRRRAGESIEEHHSRTDPVALRVRALSEELEGWQLFIALTHLFKRRGYCKVPWASDEKAPEKQGQPKKDDEEGVILGAVDRVRTEMNEKGCKYPCQLLSVRSKEQMLWNRAIRTGKLLAELWAMGKMKGEPPKEAPLLRKIYWHRDDLRDEFLEIAKAQKERFPKLAENADWLLYGDTQPKQKNGQTYHVFFNATGSRNPGVLGLRWPRFENRSPSLDALQPVDEQGRPLHVVRRDKEAFRQAQWELAVLNFRVVDVASGALVAPDLKALGRLRDLWENSKRKGRKSPNAGGSPPESEIPPRTSGEVKISEPLLKKWAAEHASRYRLVEGQQPLTPETGAGRARFASPTLNRLREVIASGRRPDTAQPVLRRPGENTRAALDRHISAIKNPLVRHRLILLRQLLTRLVKDFGEPDMIVLEAVRSLALGKAKKREYIQRLHENREERASIREELKKDGFSSSQNSILRYRLFKEAKGRCPFCLCPFCLKEVVLKEAEIEHMVPRSRVDSNEFCNLTIAHRDCNQRKGERTPWEAFGNTAEWEGIRQNAENCFGLGSLKYRLFTSPDAESLVEQKADLQHTAYVARLLRQVALIQLGWLSPDGHDPTGLKDPQKTAWRFQVTNGQLTSRLRRAWGLNQILHPLPPGRKWEELTEEEQKQFNQKNRGDLRHHALDAMVIACTLPWLAHRTYGATDEFGNHGWWTQDEKQRSKAANPIFPKEGEMHKVCREQIQGLVVRHHVPKGRNGKHFDTTRYGKRGPDLYIARKMLSKMKPKQLGKIYPESQAVYLTSAWEQFAAENPNVEGLLKEENRGKDQSAKVSLPSKFISRLCFSAYQRWAEARKAGAPLEFRWPEKVQIPFKSVSVIADDGDSAMFETVPGSGAYVSQTEFKEVRVFLPPGGKRFIPQFIRPWVRKGLEQHVQVPEGSTLIRTLRRGDVLLIKKSLREKGVEAGSSWILKATCTDGRISILPSNLASNRETLVSLGFDPANFVRVSLSDLMKALGYELPHPSSPQPQSQGPGQA